MEWLSDRFIGPKERGQEKCHGEDDRGEGEGKERKHTGRERREGERKEERAKYVDYIGKSLWGRESPAPRTVQDREQSTPGRD